MDYSWQIENTPRIGQEANAMKQIISPQIGLLMLESRFPRLPGDIGHPDTFQPPAMVKIVAGATPDRVVRNKADGLITRFVQGAQDLEAKGATLITTSCGFLVLHQSALEEAVDVPVISSSLQAVPFVEKALKPKGLRPAILTISKSNLSVEHLQAAGIAQECPIGAPIQSGAFCTSILNNRSNMDEAIARLEVVSAATALVGEHEHVGALILECTNMPPYAQEIAQLCQIPVLSLTNLLPICAQGMSLELATSKALATG